MIWAIDSGAPLGYPLLAEIFLEQHGWSDKEVQFRDTLEMLQKLRRRGLPFGELFCKTAARLSHLKALQWARLEDIPWNGETVEVAASKGYWKVLKWVLENGCDYDDKKKLMLLAAGSTFCDFSALKWLHDNQYPYEQEYFRRELGQAGVR